MAHLHTIHQRKLSARPSGGLPLALGLRHAEAQYVKHISSAYISRLQKSCGLCIPKLRLGTFWLDILRFESFRNACGMQLLGGESRFIQAGLLRLRSFTMQQGRSVGRWTFPLCSEVGVGLDGIGFNAFYFSDLSPHSSPPASRSTKFDCNLSKQSFVFVSHCGTTCGLYLMKRLMQHGDCIGAHFVDAMPSRHCFLRAERAAASCETSYASCTHPSDSRPCFESARILAQKPMGHSLPQTGQG